MEYPRLLVVRIIGSGFLLGLVASASSAADTASPAVTITAPAAGTSVPASGFPSEGTANDASGIARVSIYVYDEVRRAYTVSNAAAAYNGATSVWTFPVQTSQVSAGGWVRLWVQARDAAGNASPWKWRRVKVAQAPPPLDFQPPAVTITAPLEGSPVPLDGFPFAGTAADAGGVSQVRVYVYDEVRRAYTVSNAPAAYDQATSTWTYAVQPGHVTAGGWVRLWVQARDAAGNLSPWKWRRVRVRPPGIETLGPSQVRIEGRRLLVARRLRDGSLAPEAPFKLRGVNYSPVDPGERVDSLTAARTHLRESHYLEDFAQLQQLGANAIRTYADFGTDDVATAILNEAYARDLMVMVTLVDLTASEVTRIVTAYRTHPALLGWLIGNEWNLNLFFNPQRYPTVLNAAEAVEQTAALIHGLDPQHAVASGLGFPPDQFTLGPAVEDTLFPAVLRTAPSVQVWAFNTYRGGSLDPFFADWQAVAAAAGFGGPVFLSEFGTDDWNQTTGALDEPLQADTDEALWEEIHRHLSANDAERGCLGGFVFSWNDEWWKAPGSLYVQDAVGFRIEQEIVQPVTGEPLTVFRAHPDGFTNEEHYGLVAMDRQAKRAFWTMQEAFRLGSVRTDPVTVAVRSSGAGPSGYSVFTKRGAPVFTSVTPALHLVTLDRAAGTVGLIRQFDLLADAAGHCAQLAALVGGLTPGDVVLAGLTGGAVPEGLTMASSPLAACAEALGRLGAARVLGVGAGQSWALIALAGDSAANLAEAVDAAGGPVELAADVALDADRDGLTDPVDADHDNDGAPNAAERIRGTDVLDATQ